MFSFLTCEHPINKTYIIIPGIEISNSLVKEVHFGIFGDKVFSFFLMFDLIYLLFLENLTLTGLSGGSSQREQRMALGNLFPAFLFGLLHSLGQKLSRVCGLFVHCFFRAVHPALVLQGVWTNKTLNLGCFGPRFLSFFVEWLSHNILADIFREIEKFADTTSSFGPQAMRHSSYQ